MSEPSSFGVLVSLTAREGQRDEVLRIVTNYLGTLEDGEPGTTLMSVASDPQDDDLVWMWEEFRDPAAVQQHFRHDFFQALQLELADLLEEAPSVRPLTPIARHTSSGRVAD